MYSMSRPTSSAPKPNTRFLKTLVRDANTHNEALKKKEELEARIHLQHIRDRGSAIRADRTKGHWYDESRERRSIKTPHDRDAKRRRLNDDEDEERHKTRGRRDDHRHSRKHRLSSWSDRSKSPPLERTQVGRDRSHTETTTHTRREPRFDDYRRRDRRRSRSRSRSPQQIEDIKRRSQSSLKASTSQSRAQQDRPTRSRRMSSNSTSTTESDPLTSIIGPRPPSPTIKRGRGFTHPKGHTSTIDHRFSSTYDPQNDNPAHDHDDADHTAIDNDDWANALEALRDRQALRMKQADRMRDAGFGEELVQKWQDGTFQGPGPSKRGRLGELDGDIKDVKWRKRGEKKEWDQGKIDLDPSTTTAIGLESDSDSNSDDDDNNKGLDVLPTASARAVGKDAGAGHGRSSQDSKFLNKADHRGSNFGLSADTKAGRANVPGNPPRQSHQDRLLESRWHKGGGLMKQFRNALG